MQPSDLRMKLQITFVSAIWKGSLLNKMNPSGFVHLTNFPRREKRYMKEGIGTNISSNNWKILKCSAGMVMNSGCRYLRWKE